MYGTAWGSKDPFDKDHRCAMEQSAPLQKNESKVLPVTHQMRAVPKFEDYETAAATIPHALRQASLGQKSIRWRIPARASLQQRQRFTARNC